MYLKLENSCLLDSEYTESLSCLSDGLDVFCPSSDVSEVTVDFGRSADLIVEVSFSYTSFVSSFDLCKLFRKLRKEFRVTSYYFDLRPIAISHCVLTFTLFLDFKNYE